MKKKISLEELELELPKIELQETRFLLGGTGYSTVDGPDYPSLNVDPVSPNDPVEPVDLEPNGPEEVGGDPSGDIVDGEPSGYDDTRGETDSDYGDNEYPDQGQGESEDNYQDSDIPDQEQGEGSGSIDNQEPYPTNIDLKGNGEDIVNSIMDLMYYVNQNDYSGLSLDDVFTNYGTGAGSSIFGNAVTGHVTMEGVNITWSVHPAFDPSDMTSGDLFEGLNNLDYVSLDELSDGRVLVKISDNDPDGGTRVVLSFQSQEDYLEFYDRINP